MPTIDKSPGRKVSMAKTADWTRTDQQLPPESVEVEVMDSVGHVQTLVYASNLWWFPDRSMYVYFVPSFWRQRQDDG